LNKYQHITEEDLEREFLKIGIDYSGQTFHFKKDGEDFNFDKDEIKKVEFTRYNPSLVEKITVKLLRIFTSTNGLMNAENYTSPVDNSGIDYLVKYDMTFKLNSGIVITSSVYNVNVFYLGSIARFLSN